MSRCIFDGTIDELREILDFFLWDAVQDVQRAEEEGKRRVCNLIATKFINYNFEEVKDEG